MRDARARRHLQSFPSFELFDPTECNQPIHRRFEQQAARRPDAIAVRNGGHDVSYSHLNNDANRRARRLLALLDSETKGRPVALLLPQGYDSIAWTLAILKTGCCYAPLDQRLPPAILRAMIDNLQPVALVADEGNRGLDRSLLDDRFRLIDAAVGSEDHRGPSSNLDRPIAADAIACVFCTSGSTGRPKAVADSHRNVLHNVYRYTNTLRFAPDDRLSLVQNPSFSGTVSTLFGALANGASVVPFDLHGDGLSSLSAGVRRARVTIFHAVPSIFRELVDASGRFPDIRLIRLEGDRATSREVRHFRSNFQERCTLVNGLGATECGLARQFFVDHATNADAGDAVPIGYPVPDVAVKIVDPDGRELPAGTAGEIVVESLFLATGYWHNPSLTAQRFEAANDGQRRYRTGDLGRMDSDGCLMHLGRADHRVRIAGEFIETGDIERLLQAVPGVADAVVHDIVDRTGDQRLCAYVVRDPASNVTAERLRAALSEHVGRSAMPAAFMFLEALPLTRDLKVDRGGLPAPAGERPEMPHEYVAPATVLEESLAKVWSEALGIDAVGATDSLLALGGDSLRAAQIVNALHPMFGDRLRITTLFEHPTIRALARALERDDVDARPAASIPAPPGHSIAVIGMACRFPGAESIDDYWNNLRAGRETIAHTRPAETNPESSAAGDSARVMARGLLTEVDGFDAPLFRVTPLQAQMLDPQQRVWLECVFRAMEDAGLPVGAGEPAGATIGVFTGGRDSSYLWHLVGGDRGRVEALLDGSADDGLELLNSNDRDSIATRTAFLFGFTGPCITVQTACSTSLVAVAEACQAVVSGQCDVAIAGGVAVSFPQNRGHRHQEGGIYSRDGHCRPFDAEASGTVFSDGAGAVVLKRFEQAVADGDRIEAVIRGWAVNNDGSDKASFAAPSVKGQHRVITRAQAHAGIQPHQISYVEAHGTGTPVGDPIEFAALARAFGSGTREHGRCGLGSVKSNIGHTDTAAGIAGLIKTILALKHRELPATLHYRTPNPEIALAESPFYIVDRLRPWDAGGSTRIAGVTSLGVGGTNCHVIVEEAPPAADDLPSDGSSAYLVPLSAASGDALASLEARFLEHLSSGSHAMLASIAATTQRNRAHHAHRVAIRCATVDQLRAALDKRSQPSAELSAKSDPVTKRWQRQPRRAGEPHIGFMFPDQGSQYAGMGMGLFQACPEFRGLLQRCDALLRGDLERPLLEIMSGDLDESWTRRTDLAQPALFALEYSLAELLRTWGIQPRIVIGHGIGEYVAACIAGVFTLEEGLRLAAARGRLMQDTPPSELEAAVSRMTLLPPATALISSLSGKRVTHEVTHPRYWSAHARQPAQFAAGIETLLESGCEMLIEVGSDRVLSSLVDDTCNGRPLQTVATLQRGAHDWEAILETVARLYVAGARLDWTALQGGRRPRPVRLPTHPFTRTRFWYEGPSASAAPHTGDDAGHPLLGRRLRLPGSAEIRFEARFSRQAPQFLEDHQLFGVSLPPAASHLSMLAQAAPTLSRTASSRAFRFTALNLVRPLLLPEKTQRDVQLIFRPAPGGWDLELASADSRDGGESADWTTHLLGQGAERPAADRPVAANHSDLDAIMARCSHRVAGTDFYTRIWANQGGTGSSFRWIDSIWQGDREALCRAVCPSGIVDQAAYQLHPGIIEAACQVLHCCGEIETVEQIELGGVTYIPFSIDAFVLNDVRPTDGESWCHARLHELTRDNVVADLTILTSSGQIVASLDGFCLRQITRDAVASASPAAARPERESLSCRLPVPDPPATRGVPNAATMTRYLQQRCAEIVGGADADVPTDAGFAALGVDSLAAMRIADHLARDFGCTVSLRQILTCGGIAALAASLVNAQGRS